MAQYGNKRGRPQPVSTGKCVCEGFQYGDDACLTGNYNCERHRTQMYCDQADTYGCRWVGTSQSQTNTRRRGGRDCSPGDDCDAGSGVCDCSGNCWPYYYMWYWPEDNYCHDGTDGYINLLCPEFNCDVSDLYGYNPCGYVLNETDWTCEPVPPWGPPRKPISTGLTRQRGGRVRRQQGGLGRTLPKPWE